MPLRRMEGEVLRDSLLCVAGRLDPTPYGRPDALDVGGDGLVTAKSSDRRRWRRSIYVLKRRTLPLTILQNFDVAGMDPNCIERRESIVAPQALHLKNNALVSELAKSFAARIWNEVGDDPARQVAAAYRIAAGRDPTSEESEISLAALRELRTQWARHGPGYRHELVATTHLWIRESAPDTVYENDLVSVWSAANGDGGRRVGVLEFDVSELAGLELKAAHLELGALNQAALSQSAVVVPPGIAGINWNRFAEEKQPLARPLAQLGRVQIPAGAGAAIGAYQRTASATPEDLQRVRAAATHGGKLAITLVADEDGTAYRQDWDDGVHGSSRGKPPRLVVYEDLLDTRALGRRAMENLCHALFNSAAFLYID
jgi:hypothetical protein